MPAPRQNITTAEAEGLNIAIDSTSVCFFSAVRDATTIFSMICTQELIMATPRE
jgi:hypothetical protein